MIFLEVFAVNMAGKTPLITSFAAPPTMTNISLEDGAIPLGNSQYVRLVLHCLRYVIVKIRSTIGTINIETKMSLFN